ncbi:MAG: 4Fe-4S dicluster domain-containing protein [Syntrophaceae bacterium]
MKRLSKHDLATVLTDWAEHYTLICPTRQPPGDIIFDDFNPETFTMDYGKPPLSPKTCFLPHSEVIFTVQDGSYQTASSSDKRLIFGIRACDACGLQQAQRFMTRDKNDVYYQARWDTTLKVVVACSGPQNETCFCTTTQSGPIAADGFDLQVFDLGDELFFEIGSSAGNNLTVGRSFSDLDQKTGRDALAAFRERAQAVIPVKPEIKAAIDALKTRSPDEVWDFLGRKCITCGGCAFVCPTCTCFNIYDQAVSANSGQRIRAWDACLYGGFTREASGHNPRPSQALRLQRRHEHKLRYYHALDIGRALCGCVGCGRCSDFCPVHIGTLEVAQTIVAGATP